MSRRTRSALVVASHHPELIVKDRRGARVAVRSHVFVRSGAHRNRSGIVCGLWAGERMGCIVHFFDGSGELLPFKGGCDLVRADRCEVVL
jgi:hypothetical protein